MTAAKSTEIIVEGLYCTDKTYPELKGTFLEASIWKLSARRFEIQNLRRLNLTRLYGSYVSNRKYSAFVNLSGHLTPFFVEEDKAKKLESIIVASSDTTVKTL